MNCWICGQNADSGEHRTKKSDLGLVFPNISPDRPIYTKTEFGKLVTINSLNSDRFKSRAQICQYCNTTRTQPFDQAWEQLSTYLQVNTKRLRSSDSLLLHKVFPGRTKKAILDVHLFFVKIFGCLIIEHNVPIPIEPFSQAILSRAEHPKVYIGIGYLSKVRGKNIVQISPIDSAHNNEDQLLHFASWQYIVKEAFVNTIFSFRPEYTAILRNVWRPSGVSKVLRFSEFAPIRNLDFNHIFK